MPSNEIAGETGLFTREGWVLANELGRDSACLGVDGEGKRCFAEITLSDTGSPQQAVLLASEQAFGWFVNGTQLICKDGERVVLSTLVDEGSISEAWFENVLTPSAGESPIANVGRLWRSLSPVVPDGFNGALVKRSWRPPSAIEAELKAKNLTRLELDLVGTEGRYFVKISPSQFGKSVAGSLEETVVGIMCAGFKSADGKREEIPFNLGCFGLTYLTCLQLSGLGYSVEVDGLQYTTNWYVRTGVVGEYVFAGGKTAFRVPAASRTIRISWEDRTWIPVLSGFLSGSIHG